MFAHDLFSKFADQVNDLPCMRHKNGDGSITHNLYDGGDIGSLGVDTFSPYHLMHTHPHASKHIPSAAGHACPGCHVGRGSGSSAALLHGKPYNRGVEPRGCI
eukprot:9713816-Karenia_brevis.AAC.1